MEDSQGEIESNIKNLMNPSLFHSRLRTERLQMNCLSENDGIYKIFDLNTKMASLVHLFSLLVSQLIILSLKINDLASNWDTTFELIRIKDFSDANLLNPQSKVYFRSFNQK